MKTLYLDCGMGAAGDMLAAALLELLPDPDGFLAELNALGLPGVTFARERTTRCGVVGTRFSVRVNGVAEGEPAPAHDHEHSEYHEHEHAHEHGHEHAHEHTHAHTHRGMPEITALIEQLPLPDAVRADALAVYGLIADAESQVHGRPVSQVHFHEVGALDAVADITAVCLLLHRLSPDEILASPVRVGSGFVRCAHGTLPVPAPATALLLRDVPIFAGQIAAELCTPTGAALLRHFVTHFEPLPALRVRAVGYGMGAREFETANCLRALLCETTDAVETVTELSCNLDDMTPEAVGFAVEQLRASGALEVFTLPAAMKKSRPGVLLQVLCRPDDREKLLAQLFRHTTTLGVREATLRRYTLQRETVELQTPQGPVRCKRAQGYGVTREKFEYDDLARLASEKNITLQAAQTLAEAAFRTDPGEVEETR